MKYLVGVTVVSVLLSLAWVIDASSRPRVRRAPHSQRRGDVIYAPGRIEGMTPEIELRTFIDGRVAKLHCAAGDSVDAHQVLLELDDRQQQHEVALAESQLRAAEARLRRLVAGAHPHERKEAAAAYEAKLAELDGVRQTWERQQQLRREGAISQQEFDDQQSRFHAVTAQAAAAQARMEFLAAPPRDDELQLAQAEIDAAASRLELANLQLDRAKLRAPCAAAVLHVATEIGESTGPIAAEAAIILADTRRMRVRAFVEEFDAPRMQLGMPARITADGLPGKIYVGRVSQLSPHMTSKQIWNDEPSERLDTKTREVWIDLKNSDDLIFGLRVDVTIGANDEQLTSGGK